MQAYNVEVTGAARLHRAASRERSERGRPPGWASWATRLDGANKLQLAFTLSDCKTLGLVLAVE